MSDERPDASGWRERLRKARNADLVDVRYCARGEDVYFLLVHRGDARREAIGYFLDALRGDDMPPFDIRTIELERAAAESDSLREYVSV